MVSQSRQTLASGFHGDAGALADECEFVAFHRHGHEGAAIRISATLTPGLQDARFFLAA
jgi:hypothetical protein